MRSALLKGTVRKKEKVGPPRSKISQSARERDVCDVYAKFGTVVSMYGGRPGSRQLCKWTPTACRKRRAKTRPQNILAHTTINNVAQLNACTRGCAVSGLLKYTRGVPLAFLHTPALARCRALRLPVDNLALQRRTSSNQVLRVSVWIKLGHWTSIPTWVTLELQKVSQISKKRVRLVAMTGYPTENTNVEVYVCLGKQPILMECICSPGWL